MRKQENGKRINNMKIITLNTWGGRAGKEGLISFFEKNKDDIDVFCLQEVWADAYTKFEGHMAGGKPIKKNEIMIHGVQEISSVLKNYTGYFRPHFGDHYGLLMMVNKKHTVLAEGELFVFREKGHVPDGDVGNHARNIQYITLLINDNPLTIINFHGLWNGKGKTDTEDRINQSKNIVKFIKTLDGEVVFCGDFNLLPETESIKIIEETPLKNLIKEYNIKSTRTSFYTKPEKYADYVFVSENVLVKTFKVLPDEVSDHSPLLLEC